MVEGEEYTGNLSVSIAGKPCLTWYRYHILDSRLDLDGLPDSSWEDASNHCRYENASHVLKTRVKSIQINSH